MVRTVRCCRSFIRSSGGVGDDSECISTSLFLSSDSDSSGGSDERTRSDNGFDHCSGCNVLNGGSCGSQW